MRRREASEEEIKLFRETLRGVTRRKRAPNLPSKKMTKNGKCKDAGSAPVTLAPSRPSGLDGRTNERLRRGQIEPRSRLDLHGMNEAEAHRALKHFLKASQKRGLRLVLVVTGKGEREAAHDAPFDLGLERRSRGILKRVTPRWLAEPELAHYVADVRPAHLRHGGKGALYVYLRKSV